MTENIIGFFVGVLTGYVVRQIPPYKRWELRMQQKIENYLKRAK
ncbi:MAG: hypothetical protein WC476_12800 [Phycisphaerae bacterium]|jgi:uncharacterized membrane-anchored protein YhcB (DUF1043 family)